MSFRSFLPLLILCTAVFIFYLIKPVFKDSTSLTNSLSKVIAPEQLITSVPILLKKNKLSTLAAINFKSFDIRHKIKKGETLEQIIKGYGLGKVEVKGEPVVLKFGRKIDFEVDSQGELQKITVPIDNLKKQEIIRKENSVFASSFTNYKLSLSEKIAIGKIETSFAAEIQRAGIPYEVVDELVDIFSGKISFQRDLQKGDRFVVIYQDKLKEDGTSAGEVNILAAMIEVAKKENVAVQYKNSKKEAHYFDQDGKIYSSAFLRYPLKFSRISSHFSKSRMHPVLKSRKAHLGVDFAAPKGTPVRTVADGVVTFSGRKRGAGIMVKIKHNQRISTAYLHLSKIHKGIKNKVKVKKGELIGYVGSTGWATGPHLHFSLYDGKKAVNPLKAKLLMKSAKVVSKEKIDPSYLKRALFTLEHYKKVNLDHVYQSKL